MLSTMGQTPTFLLCTCCSFIPTCLACTKDNHTSLFTSERNQVFSVFNILCLLFQVGHEFLSLEWTSWWLLGLIPLPEASWQQRILGTERRNRSYLCRPQQPPIKCCPLSSFLDSLSFLHIAAGHSASPCDKGDHRSH